MLIDDFLPDYDIRSSHTIPVSAPADRIFQSIRAADLSGSPLARLLFAVRGLPQSALRIDGLLSIGFIHLGEIPNQEFLLGIVGQFWKPTGSLVQVSPEEFQAFRRTGYGKAAWSFTIHSLGSGRLELATETRVATYGRTASHLFRLYWLLIGPFSALIRREMLSSIKALAEEQATRDAA